jgi:hypothetical protein
MTRCPHCARPGLFPNVDLAKVDEEREALDRRYDAAEEDADRRGCRAIVKDFEDRTSRSQAVIARDIAETLRLASGTKNVYATYHQLKQAEFRIPEGSKWDKLRSLTDQALFGDYMDEVRFAALSLDGLGLLGYGECSWVLREDMIAHRTSVFEENSVMFMEHIDVRLSHADELPPGHRAPWNDRAKLCVAKPAKKIHPNTKPDDFPKLLLLQGPAPEEDDFVEVHVGGPMTVLTLERVVLDTNRLRQAIGNTLRELLENFGVKVEGRTWKP